MPSLLHEALVELFRNRPVLAAALAARLARPIVLGPGEAQIAPFVLGPQGIPVVTEIPAARDRPELAVLSAMAHGRSEAGLGVAVAALAASAGIADEARKALYADLVLSSLGEAARRAIEERMRNYEYQSEFARKYFLEGQLDPLVHLFERRLRRSLTSEERALLATRVREQGAGQVSDVVLDLSPVELAAWLGATNGH